MLRGLSRVRHVVYKSSSLCVPQQRRQLLTLAIETSCDDTCVAILEKFSCPSNADQDGRNSNVYAKLHFQEKVTASNTGKGGIHPLEALDSHREQLAKLLQKSLRALPRATGDTPDVKRLPGQDGVMRKLPDFISVTRGPGMRSNLSCGLDTAKGLATAWSIPMVGVHHMQAHALTPRLVHALENSPDSHPSPAFPFLNLLISGGHTMLLHSHDLTSHSIIANTLDTAIGDCLDKCGRSILPRSILSSTTDTSYGKHLSNYAFPDSNRFQLYYPIPHTRSQELNKPLNEYNWSFQLPLANTRQLAFSYAGIPTHVRRLMESQPQMHDHERRLLARTALGIAFEHLASRLCIALEDLAPTNKLKSPASSSASSHAIATDAPASKPQNEKENEEESKSNDLRTLVVSGGVAANPFLRYFLRATLDARGYKDLELVFPPVELCTDNAAMIAWAGMEMFEAGWRTDLGVGALRKWGMGADANAAGGDGGDGGDGGGGGILGVPGWLKV